VTDKSSEGQGAPRLQTRFADSLLSGVGLPLPPGGGGGVKFSVWALKIVEFSLTSMRNLWFSRDWAEN